MLLNYLKKYLSSSPFINHYSPILLPGTKDETPAPERHTAMSRSMVMEFASRKPQSAQDRRTFRQHRSRADMVDQMWMGATMVAFIAIIVVGAGVSLTGLAYPESIQAVAAAVGAGLGGLAGWVGFARR